jgi:hypothetical protein
MNEVIYYQNIKRYLMKNLKKHLLKKNIFFEAYDEFVANKKDTMQWSKN